MAGHLPLPQDVCAPTTMTLVSEAGRPVVDAELVYTATEPFSVALRLSLGQAPAVEWVFARDLLIQGLASPSGFGDIQIFPTPAGLRIDLQSPDGTASLLADFTDAHDFALASQMLVPPGTENRYFSIDDELQTLLTVPDRRSLGA